MRDIFIGLATPQANPTVEIEFQRFFRGPARAMVTRLTSTADNLDQRLLDYAEQLSDAPASFGNMPLGAFGFACTGSSYLVGAEREDELRDLAERRHQVQVVTATQAIRRELEGHGAQRIALLTPYPPTLAAAAARYWQALGFEVIAERRMPIRNEPGAIYRIEVAQLSDALHDFDTRGADVVLLSGTGMPTIGTLESAAPNVVSSNACLATELLRRVQLWPAREAVDIHRLLGTD